MLKKGTEIAAKKKTKKRRTDADVAAALDKFVAQMGVQLGIVVGGGNFIRGATFAQDWTAAAFFGAVTALLVLRAVLECAGASASISRAVRPGSVA